jgi:hypothetical protein
VSTAAHPRCGVSVGIEALEPRQLLAFTAVMSSTAADNTVLSLSSKQFNSEP